MDHGLDRVSSASLRTQVTELIGSLTYNLDTPTP